MIATLEVMKIFHDCVVITRDAGVKMLLPQCQESFTMSVKSSNHVQVNVTGFFSLGFFL